MAGSRPISHLESHALLGQLDRARDRLLVLAGQHLGLRASELLSLRIKSVAIGGMPKAAITIPRRNLKGGKSGRHGLHGRTIPIHPDLASEIALYLANCFPGGGEPDDFLFPSRNGVNRPLSYCQAWRILKNAAIAGGVEVDRFSTHSLRKTFAREIYATSGHDIAVTQKALGHTSILTTMSYLDADQDQVDALIRGMSSRVRPAHPAAEMPPVPVAGACQL